MDIWTAAAYPWLVDLERGWEVWTMLIGPCAWGQSSQPPPGSDLLKALDAGDERMVLELLEQDPVALEALMNAARPGQISRLDSIIARSGDPVIAEEWLVVSESRLRSRAVDRWGGRFPDEPMPPDAPVRVELSQENGSGDHLGDLERLGPTTPMDRAAWRILEPDVLDALNELERLGVASEVLEDLRARRDPGLLELVLQNARESESAKGCSNRAVTFRVYAGPTDDDWVPEPVYYARRLRLTVDGKGCQATVRVGNATACRSDLLSCNDYVAWPASRGEKRPQFPKEVCPYDRTGSCDVYVTE